MARELLAVVALFCLAAVAARSDTTGPQQEDEESTLAAGLVAHYAAPTGNVVRVDPDAQFDWESASPDPRIAAGDSFRVTWRGKLLVPTTGNYLFHLHASGRVGLRVAGRVVVPAGTPVNGWVAGDRVPLERGYSDVELEFEKSLDHARIGLFWESRAFALEPIAPRWLFHDKSPAPDGLPFEQGAELVRAYRCAACHIVPGNDDPPPAPSLAQLGGHIRREWLERWLESPHTTRSDARMPEFGLSRADAQAIAAFLVALPNPAARAARATPGRSAVGEQLFRSLGCLACHRLGDTGGTGPFAGGALDGIGAKRSADHLRLWLTKPASVNPDHRMPVFALTAEEASDLASFLGALGSAEAEPAAAAAEPLAGQGRELVITHRCAACHAIPGLERPARAAGLLARSADRRSPLDWKRSCLGSPDSMRGRPGYDLPAEQIAALRGFVDQLPERTAPPSEFERGRRLLSESNCLACHARDLARGLEPASADGPHTGDAADAQAGLRGELEPPSLTAVGDKFLDDVLARLVQGALPPRRPWLKVRMPRFAHSDADQSAILSFLVRHDRIPERPGAVASARPAAAPALPATTRTGSAAQKPAVRGDAATRGTLPPDSDPAAAPPPGRRAAAATDHGGDSSPAALDPAAALAAGHQLVSPRGFGCMSCHTLGKHQPKGIAVHARGSDLVGIGARVRHAWFLRWVKDPARIVPGMEMPSITVPVAGLLDGRVETQIEALWQALNSPSFVVPSDRDSAEQILALGAKDTPEVLRDVIFDCPPGSGWCTRSFAVGLPNRHNLLIDLDSMSLRGWWIGDFARERTEAKTWLWEPAGLPVWSRAAEMTTVALRRRDSGEIAVAQKEGQTVGWLEGWERSAASVSLSYRLRFVGLRWVRVRETIRATEPSGPPGFVRDLVMSNVPAEFEAVALEPARDTARVTANRLTRTGPLGATTVEAPGGTMWQAAAAGAPADAAFAVPGAPDASGDASYHLTLRYTASFVTPRSAERPARPEQVPTLTRRGAAAAPAARRAPEQLSVLPGYEATRLPLDPSVMPTAIAFRPDGTPVVCSLRGEVLLARDTDGDGIEDTWTVFSDHLAAPFGVLTDGDDVIVSHKPEVVRLVDSDGDGRADQARVIATGWGYDPDYHDWTFGLVRDSQRNLYVTLGSDYQSPKRPEAARPLRGHALRIAPTGNIEDLARGLRFAVGLAINREDQVFFSDNQGVQNTFNEINHLVPSARYGVPALADPPADQDAWPERKAAIEIPHPLTRSVNGICFLDSGGDRSRSVFGPFARHGVGCEYDTRGLIRFTLQKVGDTYQGACYPFSLLEGLEGSAGATASSGAGSDRAEPVLAAAGGAPDKRAQPADQPAGAVPRDTRSQFLGPIACAVSPNGDLYVGGMRDSGWGGGNNVGELVRIRPHGVLPLGVREVRAFRNGFVIGFTGPVQRKAADDPAQYSISSYRRIWRGTYATPDSDRRNETVHSVRVTDDGRSVVLMLDGMRAGFVYDIHVRSVAPDAASLWPADAYYTLNQIPDASAADLVRISGR